MNDIKALLTSKEKKDRRVRGIGCAVVLAAAAAVILIVRANRPVAVATETDIEAQMPALAEATEDRQIPALAESTAAGHDAEATGAASGRGAAGSTAYAETDIRLLPVPDTTFSPVDLTSLDGVLYITDAYNKVVWSADAGEAQVHAGAESVEDIYGEPIGGYNDAGLSESLFGEPWGIAPFIGGLAVSDPENQAVRFIDADGASTVNARSARLKSGELGVRWERPTGLAAGDDGELFVADSDAGRVVVITPEGAASPFVEELDSPTGLCFRDGVLYIAESGANRVLRVDAATGESSVLAGSGEEGHLDGSAKKAQFSSPQGIAVADDGSVYVADTVNSAVRRIADGRVETVLEQTDDALMAGPVSPTGLFIDGGTLYICDRFARQVIVLDL